MYGVGAISRVSVAGTPAVKQPSLAPPPNTSQLLPSIVFVENKKLVFTHDMFCGIRSSFWFFQTGGVCSKHDPVPPVTTSSPGSLPGQTYGCCPQAGAAAVLPWCGVGK